LTSYTVTITEGSGGYVAGGYVSSGYVVAQTTMADTLAKSYGAQRTASGALTITGLIPNLFIGRGIAQVLTNIGTVSRKLAATRQLTTGAGGYTSSGYLESGYLTANITQIIEVLTKVRSVNKTLTEAITNINTVGRIYAALRTISEAPTITETLDRLYGAVRTLTQTVTNTNSVSRVLAALRTITPTLTITSLLTSFKGIAGTGASRLRYATSYIFKRTGITSVFKRSGNSSF